MILVALLLIVGLAPLVLCSIPQLGLRKRHPRAAVHAMSYGVVLVVLTLLLWAATAADH
jgi:hypothetical protein